MLNKYHINTQTEKILVHKTMKFDKGTKNIHHCSYFLKHSLKSTDISWSVNTEHFKYRKVRVIH